MDQSAEPVSPYDAHTGHLSRRMRTSGGRVLLQGPVRPVSVVVIWVLGGNEPQVPFTGDQHPVRALAADAASEPAVLPPESAFRF
jgi:hypothetical protein